MQPKLPFQVWTLFWGILFFSSCNDEEAEFSPMFFTESDYGTCGGDVMAIDWAVPAVMEGVALNGIDFIKEYSGVWENAGWFGEVITEMKSREFRTS